MFLRHRLVLSCIALVFTVALTGPTRATAQAGQGSALNGRVTDSTGGALRNAEVSLVPVTPAMPGMKMAAPPPIAGRVNADGTFTVTQVPPGQYVLQVDA